MAGLGLAAPAVWAAPTKKPPPKPKLIALDPGHGGHDPGALGYSGTKEKSVVITVARDLVQQLQAGKYRVMLTRASDTYVPLRERVARAQDAKADLFLSIHADSAGDKSGVTGASVYTLSGRASSEAAARFAARENSADTVNGVALANQDEAVSAILVELSQRRAQGQSEEFAGLILREGDGLLQFHPQPRRSAALVVLKAPDVPSALFEAGFVSNPEEAGWLASPQGQARFAEAMSRAIRVYFARQAGV